MAQANGEQILSDGERTEMIGRVVDQVIQRRHGGESLTDEQVVAEHSNLMPDLGQRLRQLAQIEKIRAAAATHPPEALTVDGPLRDMSRSEATESPGHTIPRPLDRGFDRESAGITAAVSLEPRVTRSSDSTDISSLNETVQAPGRTSVGASVNAVPPDPVEATLDSPRAPTRLHSPPGQAIAKPSLLAQALQEEQLPEQIGPFVIRKLLGRGGMGVVYESEQSHPRRTVALKVIHANCITPSTLRRFELEADTMARLEHPGIARMYEAGMAGTSAQPQPYFAMELIRGQTLIEYADSQVLDRAARIDLLARICDAVHYAHQRSVIHRDLKPANILVDQSGQPKVLDFGVARVTDSDCKASTLSTEGNALVGTILYMSPEQAGGDTKDLDTRSDIYALGVIGFELLAGRHPHNVVGKPVAEVLRMVRFDPPARLASVNRALAGDVDAIIAKALEVDRDCRYSSASGLAADLRRHLDQEPVLARAQTFGYRSAKFARRHVIGVGALGAVLLALLIGGIASAVLQHRTIVAQKDRANADLETERQTGVAARERDAARMALANSLVDQGGAMALAGMAGSSQKAYDQAVRLLKVESGLAWQVDPAYLDLWQFAPPAFELFVSDVKPLRGVGLLHDGRTVWTAGGGKLIKFDGPTGQLRDSKPIPGATFFAWDDESSTLVAAGSSGLWVVDGNSDARQQLVEPTDGSASSLVAIAPGGRYVAAQISGAGPGGLRVWDLQAHTPPWQIASPQDPPSCLAISREGRWMIAGSSTGAISAWDVPSGRLTKSLDDGQSQPVTCALFTGPDALVTGSTDKSVRVWDLATGSLKNRLTGHRGRIVAIAASSDGKQLLSASSDQTIKLWDLDHARAKRSFAPKAGAISALSLANSVRCGLATTDQGEVQLMDLDNEIVPRIGGVNGELTFAAVSPDGLLAVTGAKDSSALVLDLATGRVLQSIDAKEATCAVFVPKSGLVVICGPKHAIRAWDLERGRWAWEAASSGIVNCVAATSDGLHIACGNDSGEFDWFNAHGRKAFSVRGTQLGVSCVAVSPDGKHAAFGTIDSRLFLCDIEAQTARELGERRSLVSCLAFDHNGKRLVAGDYHDGTVRVWEVTEQQLVHEFSGHEAAVTAAQFSTDDQWILSGGADGSLKVWSTTGSVGQVGTLVGDDSSIFAIELTAVGWKAFSRQGRIWDFSLPMRYRLAAPKASAAREDSREGANSSAMATLGEWYWQWGPKPWALDLVLDQAKTSTAPYSHLLRARCYWEIGKGQEAAREFGLVADPQITRLYLALCGQAAGRAAPTSTLSESRPTRQGP